MLCISVNDVSVHYTGFEVSQYWVVTFQVTTQRGKAGVDCLYITVIPSLFDLQPKFFQCASLLSGVQNSRGIPPQSYLCFPSDWLYFHWTWLILYKPYIQPQESAVTLTIEFISLYQYFRHVLLATLVYTQIAEALILFQSSHSLFSAANPLYFMPDVIKK